MSMGHTLPAYPQSLPALGTYRAGMMDYVRGLSLVAWLFLMVVGFWWQSDWYAAIDLGTRDRLMQMFQIGFGIAVAGHATLAVQKIWGCPFLIPTASDLKAAMLCVFCISMLLFSPLSVVPSRSALYAVLTLGTLCLCYLLWVGNYELLRRMLVLAGILMLAFLVFLIFQHGLIRGGVGGINRNRYAHAAFACMVYLLLSKNRWKWLPILLAISLVFLVNSRGTIIAVAAFLGIYLLLTKGMNRAIMASVAGIFVLAFAMLMPTGERLIKDQLFQSASKARGVGSGFSGRVERWKQGYQVFRRNPFLGVGFRASNVAGEGTVGAHSGYINLLKDTGLIGTALVLGAYLYDARRRFYWLRKIRRQYGYEQVPLWLRDSVQINVIMCCLYVVMAGVMIYEPMYLHLGSPFTIMFFIFLCSPLELVPPQTAQRWRGGQSLAYAYRA